MVRVLLLAGLLAGCADQLLPLLVASDAGVDGGSPFGVELIATSYQHTCAIQAGALYCWGGNTDGELGLGNLQPRNRPTAVDAGTSWVELGVGYGTTCARRSDNTVWCWGKILGGTGAMKMLPAQFSLPSPALALSLHFGHACVIGADRVLRCWGANGEGQLGLDDGFPGAGNQLAPMPVAGGGQWASVASGDGHTCAIQTNGTAWCWGRNMPPLAGQPMGQPGQFRRPVQVGADTDWAQIRSSQNTACALKTNGSMWCWGAVFDAPVGTHEVFGPTRVGTDTDWRALEFETFSICGLKTSGAMWCWGRNDEGQLGTGDLQSVYTPQPIDGGPWRSVAVGRFHHCAIDQSGAVLCTGANEVGQLGLGDTMRRQVLTPVTF